MRVTLFRDLPEEGWPSMEVYADRLAAGLAEAGLEVRLFPTADRPVPLAGWGGIVGLYLRRSLLYPLAARRAQGDVNHVVDHSYGHLLHFLDPRRTIVTCHDLTPLVRRHELPQPSVGLALWAWAFQGMLKAARIIANSYSTRNDILRFSNYDPASIAVIPMAVEASFAPLANQHRLAEVRRKYRLPNSSLILHVGHCQERKNIKGLLQALALLRKTDEGRKLILAQVGGRFSPQQRRLIDRLGLSEAVVQVLYAAADDLPALYNLADVFVFPSFYEGFGLPPLEAMACGTPVVCSNVASLPEVVGDAALTVAPDDTEGLAAAIARVLDDPALADDLRRRGLERARQFTWERCARETLAVYQELYD